MALVVQYPLLEPLFEIHVKYSDRRKAGLFQTFLTNSPRIDYPRRLSNFPHNQESTQKTINFFQRVESGKAVRKFAES